MQVALHPVSRFCFAPVGGNSSPEPIVIFIGDNVPVLCIKVQAGMSVYTGTADACSKKSDMTENSNRGRLSR